MKNRILIGLPTYNGQICVELMAFALEAGNSDYPVILYPVKKKPTDVARNLLVSLAQHHQAHLIMVDYDAAPAPGTFTALADKICSEPCVAAVPYCAAGGQIVAGEESPLPKDVVFLDGWTKVDNCGTHCCGYHIKVFDRIGTPHFEYHYNSSHTALAGYAEDTVFHRKLREAGVPIYINYSLWAGHIIPKEIGKPKVLTPFEKALVMEGL